MARDDDTIVPLDARTLRWLARLSEFTGDKPPVLVAKLLKAMRIDDEFEETTH